MLCHTITEERLSWFRGL